MKITPIHYGIVKQFPQGKEYVRLCDEKLPKDDLDLLALVKEETSCKRCLLKLHKREL